MDSLLQDVRYAVRMLTKNPGFTAVAVIVLAIGIGANTATFSLTNTLLLRPIQAHEPERLVALYNKHTVRPDSYRGFSYPNFEDIRALNDVFESVMSHDLQLVGITDGDVTERVFAEFSTHDYLETFGLEPAAGRFFSVDETAPGSGEMVVLVGYERWQRAGGGIEVIGSEITVNGYDMTVIGVMPQHFTGRTAMLSPGVYLPFGVHHLLMGDSFSRPGINGLEDRGSHGFFIVGRLRDGLTVEDANERLGALGAQLEEAYPEANLEHTITTGPLSRMSIGTSPPEDEQVGLVTAMLLGMTSIVLLIACINLANLLLARAASRRREFAIRAAIGGGRARIIRQLLTEGLLLAGLGGLTGLVVSYWANSLLVASITEVLSLQGLSFAIVWQSTPDLSVILVTAAFCVLGTLLFGLGPAMKQSRPDVMEDLKEGAGAVGRGGHRFFAQRNLLVVSQVALSLVMLVSAGLFVRGAMVAANVEPGFDLDHGLLLEVDPGLVGYDEARNRQLYSNLHDRLIAIPGIEAASVAATVPFGSTSSGRLVRRAEDLPGSSGDSTDDIATFRATFNAIGADYFAALDVPILQGRAFTRAEAETDGGPPVAIIDRRLAEELWPGENPIGREIGFGRQRDGDDMQVVGVVATVRDDLLPAELNSHVYRPHGQAFQGSMSIHLRTATAEKEAQDNLLQAVRREVRGVDANLPVMRLTSMRSHLEGSASLWLVRLGATVFGAFGALALFVSVVGVYGVKAYAVAQRTREIGIRKALGATSNDTVWLVVREGLALTAVGLAIGIVLSAGVATLLSSILYEVSALDPIAFLIAPAVLAAAALVASYLPARRAANVAPVTALRQE